MTRYEIITTAARLPGTWSASLRGAVRRDDGCCPVAAVARITKPRHPYYWSAGGAFWVGLEEERWAVARSADGSQGSLRAYLCMWLLPENRGKVWGPR